MSPCRDAWSFIRMRRRLCTPISMHSSGLWSLKTTPTSMLCSSRGPTSHPPVQGPVCADCPPPQTAHVLSWATRDHRRATQSDHTHLHFRIALTELRCKVTCPILLYPLRNNSSVTASVFVKTTQSRREIHHWFGCQNAAENFVRFIRRCPPL